MAKRRKGVTPAHLRPYLFKKGHGKVRKRKGGSASHLARYRFKPGIHDNIILSENPRRRRKGRRKGVTPPHLRPFLFKKGHGKVRRRRSR